MLSLSCRTPWAKHNNARRRKAVCYLLHTVSCHISEHRHLMLLTVAAYHAFTPAAMVSSQSACRDACSAVQQGSGWYSTSQCAVAQHSASQCSAVHMVRYWITAQDVDCVLRCDWYSAFIQYGISISTCIKHVALRHSIVQYNVVPAVLHRV